MHVIPFGFGPPPPEEIIEQFGFGPPPPEEIIEQRKSDEKRAHTALPIVKEIREKLRELASVGYDTSDVKRCRRKMAVLQEEIETFFVRPLPLPPAQPKKPEATPPSAEPRE